MNRRSFLKLAGGLVAAAVVAPPLEAIAAPAFIPAARLDYVPKPIASASGITVQQVTEMWGTLTVQGGRQFGKTMMLEEYRRAIADNLGDMMAAVRERLLMDGEAVITFGDSGLPVPTLHIYEPHIEAIDPDLRAIPFRWDMGAPKPILQTDVGMIEGYRRPAFFDDPMFRGGLERQGYDPDEMERQHHLSNFGAHRRRTTWGDLTPAQRKLRTVHDDLIARGEWPKIARSERVT